MTRYYHSYKLLRRFFSVSHHNFFIFHLTLFALITFFVSSCEEGPTKIGNDLLPGNDFVTIESTDTLSVFSYTMYDEAVRTDNPTVSYLGQIYDPYFGTTTAEFVTQIRMGAALTSNAYIIDSIYLFLSFLDVKGGKAEVNHTLRLTEIDEQIYTDSAYYSNKQVLLKGYDIAEIQLPVLKPDTINNISLKLPDVDFGYYLLRDPAWLFYSNTKPDFRSFFKGLYFRIDTGPDPLLATLSLQPQASTGYYSNYFVIFMKDENNNQVEVLFILDAANRNASFNLFSHRFSTAILGNKMENRNIVTKPTASDTLSYMQYLNGVYTKITIPGLENIKNNPAFDNIAINKAKLKVPVFFDGDLYKASKVPSQLYLRYRTKSGIKYYVPDFANINPSFFDGRLDSTANVYNFNIPAFIQSYLKDASGEILPELEMFQVSGTKNVILKANSSKTPVKLEFTYSRF